MTQQNSILAFDFGLKRVGVALSKGSLAEPLQILPNDEKIWSNIKQLVDQFKPSQFIIGVSERQMAELSQEFGKTLQSKFNLPITFVDESFSSEQVKHKLHSSKPNKKKYQGKIDHFAAALILQDFLDEQG